MKQYILHLKTEEQSFDKLCICILSHPVLLYFMTICTSANTHTLFTLGI